MCAYIKLQPENNGFVIEKLTDFADVATSFQETISSIHVHKILHLFQEHTLYALCFMPVSSYTIFVWENIE